MRIKILVLVAFMIVARPAFSAGLYDGVWSFDVEPSASYFSMHQRGSVVLAAGLSLVDGGWSAYKGTINGSVVFATLVFDTMTSGRTDVRVDFATPTAGELTVISCQPGPGEVCLYPPGTKIPIVKIF